MEGLTLSEIDSADNKERANIISGTFAFDEQLTSAESKDLIAKVRYVTGQHATLLSTKTPVL